MFERIGKKVGELIITAVVITATLVITALVEELGRAVSDWNSGDDGDKTTST